LLIVINLMAVSPLNEIPAKPPDCDLALCRQAAARYLATDVSFVIFKVLSGARSDTDAPQRGEQK
ncbi:MAG: hypothetical protein ACRC2U_02535, partial [Aeromonas sp.]